MGIRGELFSAKAPAGKRTYFFNVKENRNSDIFLNLVESKKHGDENFERHSIIIFEEDIDKFFEEFQKAVEFIRQKRKRVPHNLDP